MTPAEDIKSRLDIADLIGEYLTLKPAGSGAFKALCPFHGEKTPSFHVSRGRQSWHCFGCDIGGDHFSFVMKMEGIEFPEALELLAQKTGVILPVFDAERSSERKRLFEVNDLAARFFRSALHTLPAAEHARAYVARRGLDELTMDLFRIGYAPAGWTVLTEALTKRGVTEEELLKVGLVARREKGSGVYDRFRDRLMFAIADDHGRIVGFTGRLLADAKDQAKYVNTPETVLYRKSAVLYGLDKAKGEIRRQDLAVIVEGNMDVVSSHQFGVLNVVASSGTALTSEQLRMLKRFTTHLAIAFDQDAAGSAATLRGLDLARREDFSIRIITLPPEAGKDPDEAVRKDPALWTDAIKEAVGIMEWIYRRAFRDRHSDRPEDKKAIAADVLPEVARIADPVERDHWLLRLAGDLGVSEQALREALRMAGSRTSSVHRAPLAQSSQPTPAEGGTRQSDPEGELERTILAFLLIDSGIWNYATEELAWQRSEIHDPLALTLYETLEVGYAHNNLIQGSVLEHRTLRPPEGLTSEQASLFDRLAFLAEREAQDHTLDSLKHELKIHVSHLRDLRKARERKRLEQAMRDAERAGDDALIQRLVKEFSET